MTSDSGWQRDLCQVPFPLEVTSSGRGIRNDPGRRWQVLPECALPPCPSPAAGDTQTPKKKHSGWGGVGRGGQRANRIGPCAPRVPPPPCSLPALAAAARLTGFELRLSVRPDPRPPQCGECAESLRGTGCRAEGTGETSTWPGPCWRASTPGCRGWVCPGREPEVLTLDDSTLRGRGAGGPLAPPRVWSKTGRLIV